MRSKLFEDGVLRRLGGRSGDRTGGRRGRTRPAQRSWPVILVGLLVAPPAAVPATITVSGLDSTVAVDGLCSLREAIDNANADADTSGGDCPAGSGADTLELTGDITLTEVDHTITGNGNDSGLPRIVSDVTIEGNGFAIQRDAAAPNFRIFEVDQFPAVGALRFESTSIQGGSLGYYAGAGISNSGGTVTLVDSTVSGNSALHGSGIYNGFGGTVELIGSSVSDNSGNAASSKGAGIRNSTSTASTTTLILINSSVSDNTGGNGAGIYSDGPSVVTITDSVLAGNASDGGLGGGAIGLGANAYHQASITSSTISGNSAFQGGGVNVRTGAKVILTNSTVSGNTAVNSGGGIFAFNGGLVYVDNSTVAANNAPYWAGIGGWAVSSVTLTNGVVGANLVGSDCGGATIVDGGNSFDEDGTCGVGGALTGLDPVLADNGGPTPTHALLPGSSAADAAGVCGLAVDQRGYLRDALCDSGAFELDGVPPSGTAIEGSVRRIKVQRLECRNLTSGQVVEPAAGPGWDCTAVGLLADTGEFVRQRAFGRAKATAGVGGSVDGVTGALVRCANVSTGLFVEFTPSAMPWDCVAEGLSVTVGDRIDQTVTGIAE